MKNLTHIFAAVMIVLLPFSYAQARSSGVTGASQGVACNACHSGGITPTVVLAGPNNVTPGSTNTYTMTMTGGQQISGGLNVSATDGTLLAIEYGTWVTNGELHHYVPFYADASGQIIWTFEWLAPNVAAT